jgi:hypothetical protein
MPRRRGLLRTAARTAVIAGTAKSVSGRVARRQQQNMARDEAMGAHHGSVASVAPRGLGENDLVGSLQRLADLKSAGALTAQEYSAAKSKLLAS